MAEISIGQLKLVSKSGLLSVSSGNSFGEPVTLNVDEVGELIAFLVSLTTTEFNQRQSFRIPLWYAISLNVSVTLIQGSESVTASPVNLSLTGMLVDLPDDDAFEIRLNEFMEVDIEFEGKSARIPMRVQRKEGPRVALDQLNAREGGDSSPTRGYADIVMAIQRRWVTRFKSR